MVGDDESSDTSADRLTETPGSLQRSSCSEQAGDVTRVLSEIKSGDPAAAEQLLPLVYGELRRLATQKMAREKPGQTLQATALVHEAYMRMVDSPSDRCWASRRHFFASAAEVMRRILIDQARRKNSGKRGGDWNRVELDEVEAREDLPSDELLALHEALEKLEHQDKLKADLVKLRYFAGFTNREAADALGISVGTAEKYWSYARCWLRVTILNEDAELQ